ncbi:MAG: NAD(P)/FAD-dependent oxidoreductase [Gemmatimonadales bacterium]
MTSDVRGTPLWDLELGPEQPALDGVVETDVCVIGLGGSGLSCVRELRRQGVRVAGIDAGRVGWGAAGRNGGFLLAGLAPFYHEVVERFGRERARALYRLTLEELDYIESEAPAGVSRHGSLRIAETPEELADCETQRAAMCADGFSAERYDGPEGQGIMIPGDGTFQPLARCRSLASRAMEEGATLYERTAVTRIADGRVRVAQGEVRCRLVVVAVDGRLERLLPELTGTVRTARLQMLATEPTSEIHLTRPVYARWGYDYWQQRPDGAIALGGARDVAGESEWTWDASPTDAVQDALERRLRERLGVQARITHRWAASVGYTSTGLPVLREVRPGVWAIGGYCGTGNVVGSLLGRGLARWLVGGDDAIVRPFMDVSGG